MAEQKKAADAEAAPEKTEGKDNTKEKEAGIEIEGIVREAVKGRFRVEITPATPNGEPFFILAHIAGKLRHHFIKIVPGDRVKVEVSPYDITKGRITFRLK